MYRNDCVLQIIKKYFLSISLAQCCAWFKLVYCITNEQSNGRFFFQTQKLTWWPHPICTSFGVCIKRMQVFIFRAKCIDFCIDPLCTGALNAVNVFFSNHFLNIIVDFLLKFDGFKGNFINFTLDAFSLSHPNFTAIGLTVTKPSANKCRSLCKLISNSMQANFGQTNDGIAMKLRYRLEWVLQS